MTELLTQLIVPVIVLACYVIAELIKVFTPVNDVWLPIIVAVAGIFFSVWYNDWTITFPVFVTGLLSGAAATWLHELVKNPFKYIVYQMFGIKSEPEEDPDVDDPVDEEEADV